MSFSPGPSSSSSIEEQRQRWENKRIKTSKQLVQTEQKYCQQLQLITTYFVEILNAKGTLKQEVRETIFSSIKNILSANQSLLVHLENGYFGRGFDSFCPQLHHYSTYADNFYTAQRVLKAQLKKSKAFRHFKSLQENRSEFRGQTLEELLELPLTRVQQYKDFLDDLAANTSPSHSEFTPLSRAVRAVSELCDRIEENTRRHENNLQIQRVQRLLQGSTRVYTPGRWYIREGWMKVVPPKGTEAKPKMLFLFSDVLLLTCRCSLHLSHHERFKVQRVYPLQNCTIERVFGHTRSQGGLLSLTFPKAKLLLMSNDQQDFNEWFQSLSSTLRKLQSKPTVVHDREELRPVTESSNSATTRKRPAVNTQSPDAASPSVEVENSAPKRRKQDTAVQSADSSCVIL